MSADVWEGDATKHFSVKNKGFSVNKVGGNSVNEGCGEFFLQASQFSEEVRAIQ